MTTIQTTHSLASLYGATSTGTTSTGTTATGTGPRPEADAFTSRGTTYGTLAGVATRLAVLAVEDTLNGSSEDRTLERITLVEHLMRFANAHGSTRPASALRQAMAGMQFALGQPGTPVLSVLEELQIATSQTQ